MGEEAFGPVKVIFPSIGECQDQEAGVGEEGMGGFGGEIRKGDNI